MRLYLIPLLFALTGCSLQKMALRSATPVFEKTGSGIMKEGNWDFFEASSPANLKFMELIWEQDRDNLRLLSVLIKSYAGYAFGVHETLAFQDELMGVEDSESKKNAILFYTRALDYGLLYLKEKGISPNDLLSSDETEIIKKLNQLDENDTTALLYTGQSWGSLINLQKDNIALVSQVPKVKLLFDRVCEIKPDIDHNVCDIFYAQYESSRPKMLGGNPEKGEELFLKAMARYPQNLLIRMNYVQYVLVPAMDSEKYEKEAAFLTEEFAKWGDLNRDNLENVSPYRDAPELNLYNAIAKKRFLIIEKNKKKIF
jgi:TRAP transporter T-component